MNLGNRYYSDAEAKSMIIEIGRRMYEKGFVSANDGNISILVDENVLWTTPTMVSKGFMTEEMLVKVDLEGNRLEGEYEPSSELKMHLRVYRENPTVRAVTHAHPPYSTAFAIANIPLEEPFLAEAITNLGKVPVAPYATPGTQQVPDSITPYCKDHNAVLLQNHGALTWGSSALEAYYRLESLEFYAREMLLTKYIICKQTLIGK